MEGFRVSALEMYSLSLLSDRDRSGCPPGPTCSFGRDLHPDGGWLLLGDRGDRPGHPDHPGWQRSLLGQRQRHVLAVCANHTDDAGLTHAENEKDSVEQETRAARHPSPKRIRLKFVQLGAF